MSDESVSPHLRRLRNRVSRTADRLIAHAARNGLTVPELVNVQLPWYEIRSGPTPSAEDGTPTPPAAPAADPVEVLIYDEIGGSLGVSASQFAEDLQQITASTIHLRVNSPGGSVFDALAIHSSLLHHPARVIAFVDGVAASAASFLILAADEVVMMPGAQLMIHDAMAHEEGNTADMQHMATFLNRQSDNIASLYQGRGGGELTEWRELMLAETWMYGQEAVDLRLADRVYTPARDAPEPVDERMSRAHDLRAYRHAGRAAAPSPRRHSGAVSTRETVTVTRWLARTADEDTRGAEMADIAASVAEAAAARAQAAHRRAHATAQEGRKVPVLDTSPQYRSALRAVRALPSPELGAARVQAFEGRLQRVKMVTRGVRELAHVAGYATVFGRRYQMWDDAGPYWEVVASGALTRALGNPGLDVAFLVNHRGVTMARTTNGTLELAVDGTGLADDAYLNPARSDVQLLLSAIDDGLITEQSFTFQIVAGEWSDDFQVFSLLEVDPHRGDVSPVNYGANHFTSVAARGQEMLPLLDALPAGLARAAYDRLTRRADVRASLADTAPPAHPEPSRTEVTADSDAGQPMPAGRRITQIEAMLGLDDV